MLSDRSQASANSGEALPGTTGGPRSMLTSQQVGFRRTLLMTTVCYLAYLFTLAQLASYREFLWGFGDNSPYTRIAAAIEHWAFAELHVKLFWGLPYMITAVSSVTRLSNLNALLAISVLASLVTVGLIYKLWGGWVALAFVILSREWLERSLLGGAEPLFLALLFSGFLAARREKWGLAALLASLATVVRPMGIFGLVGIGLVLIQRREYRKFALASAIGSGIGLLYILPLKLYFGDPMANVRGYDHADWSSNSPLTFPFAAIVHNALAGGSTRLNVARTVVWIAFILVAAALMVRSGNLLLYTRTAPTEIIFWALYLLFLFTYNSSWAWGEFPRFAIPLVPFSAYAVERWIPRTYWLLFALGVLAAVLSAAETVGIVSTLGRLRQAF
ncbi:MAG TPA: hypothetical protein VFE61_11760 [Candidatus Sulfotelmatobacter sp.]|nr:hypothetical protein [Candidatus Sulfotelmatobacter sp.]